MDDQDELIRQWRVLTQSMNALMTEHAELAARRAEVTRKLYARPEMTHRKLGVLLGVSGVTINLILHRDEPKPGRLLIPAPRR